ncbi:unnamed protein product, partial [Lymnaea stagnalis]
MCDLLQGLIPNSLEERKNMSNKHMERLFVYCLLWSHGALLELEDRAKLQEFLLKHRAKLDFPKLVQDETIFEFMVSQEG